MELNWLQILILGAVQGFSEILPLSASGFQAIALQLLGLPPESGSESLYSALARIAVVSAVCLVLRRDLAGCLRALSARPERRRSARQEEEQLNRRMLLLIFLGTLPVIPALIFRRHVVGAVQNLLWIAVLLLLNGLVVFASDRIGHGSREIRSATAADGLCLGVAQALSVIPGLSRTGLTVSMGVFRGLDLEFSWKFSFLLSIPAMLLQALLELTAALQAQAVFSPACLAGMAVAGLCAYVALRLLRFTVRRNAFGGFAYAVWGAGLFAFILYLIC